MQNLVVPHSTVEERSWTVWYEAGRWGGSSHLSPLVMFWTQAQPSHHGWASWEICWRKILVILYLLYSYYSLSSLGKVWGSEFWELSDCFLCMTGHFPARDSRGFLCRIFLLCLCGVLIYWLFCHGNSTSLSLLDFCLWGALCVWSSAFKVISNDPSLLVSCPTTF